jgi:hypothetical protein
VQNLKKELQPKALMKFLEKHQIYPDLKTRLQKIKSHDIFIDVDWNRPEHIYAFKTLKEVKNYNVGPRPDVSFLKDPFIMFVHGTLKEEGNFQFKGTLIAEEINIEGTLMCKGSLIVLKDVRTHSALIEENAVVFGTWSCLKSMSSVFIKGYGILGEFYHIDQGTGWIGLEGDCLIGKDAKPVLEKIQDLFSKQDTPLLDYLQNINAYIEKCKRSF